MAKYKYYDYSQSVLIPVSLEEQLIPGTLEFAIQTLVETRVDTSVFDDRYSNDETGRLAYDPKILLKVVLFGYSRGLIASRQIERACQGTSLENAFVPKNFYLLEVSVRLPNSCPLRVGRRSLGEKGLKCFFFLALLG